MTTRQCSARTRYLELDEHGGTLAPRTRCTLEAGHDGPHFGDRAISPRPVWSYEGQVVDLRETA